MSAETTSEVPRERRRVSRSIHDPGRRWNDDLGDAPTRLFTDFLLARPDREAIVHYLIALLAWQIGAQAALLVEGAGDDCRLTAALDTAPSSAARTWAGNSTCAELAEIVAGSLPTSFPTIEGRTPVIVELGSEHSRTGAVLLMYRGPGDPQRVRHGLQRIASMLSLYLAGLEATPARQSTDEIVQEHTTAVHLSARQQKILLLLAEDLTMRQIASRIGYSDSTVRMESLAIYRGLGVHDRSQAVAVGIALGLIDRRVADEPLSS